MTGEENCVVEFISGVKLLLLGGCVLKALEGDPSAMACRLTAMLSSVSVSWVLPGLVGKPVALGRTVTPLVGRLQHRFGASDGVLTADMGPESPEPADPVSVCRDTAGHMIKERFRSVRLRKLLSSSRLSFFFP